MDIKRFLIIDIGTSSIRVSVVDQDLTAVDSEKVERKVAHTFSADQEWRLIKTMIIKITSRNSEIDGIAVSSLLSWVGVDKSGEAVTPCYSYMHQCPEQFSKFKQVYSDEQVYFVAGRCINPELASFKIKYLKDEEPDVYAKLYKFISLKDYINLKLTGEIGIDQTTACYSMVYDLHEQNWSDELASMVGIDTGKLPGLVKSFDQVGITLKEVSRELGLKQQVPVAGGSVDGSVGILGAGGLKTGIAVSVMGTTDVSFIVTDKCKLEHTKRLVVNPHVIPSLWLIGGPMGMFGGTIDWIFNNILYNHFDRAKMQELAEKIPVGCEDLTFIPTLLGERTPFWSPKIKGTMFGLSPDHKAEHIYRAVMEANGYTFRKIIELAGDSGVNFSELIAIGGGSNNKLWLQIRSNIIKKPTAVVNTSEATTTGSAMLLMLMLGSKPDQLPVVSKIDIYDYDKDASQQYDDLYAKYLKLMSAAESIY